MISLKKETTINNNEPFTKAYFSKDGHGIITYCNEREYWDLKLKKRLSNELELFEKNLPKNKRLKEIYHEGVAVIDTNLNIENSFFKEPFIDCVEISPNGKLVAIGYSHGRLRIENTDGSPPIFLKGHSTSMNNHMYQNSIEYLEFDSSSNYLVSMAMEDDNPCLWDLTSDLQNMTWNNEQAYYLENPLRLGTVTDGGIDMIRFSPIEPKIVVTHRFQKTAQIYTIVS